MTTSAAAVLLHPVRLRIVLAMGDEQLTTAEIAQHLPDVAQATLYRHVAVLADAGVLQVAAERRVRGSVERTYSLVTSAATLGPEDAGRMSQEEHLRGFITFAASLIDAFGRYISDPAATPASDMMGYRQVALWLDENERERLTADLREVLERYRANDADGDRTRVLLNTILIPDLVATERSEEQNEPRDDGRE
jgi:DNA-binding transcriptional ArsR family regulator